MEGHKMTKEEPCKNVAWEVLVDLETEIRDVHRMAQICRTLVQDNAESDIIGAAVHFAASMAFDLEKKYDEAFHKAARRETGRGAD
jgi:hypothetical protein